MPTHPSDRRVAPRSKVFEVSIITTDGATYRAHLLDLNLVGVRAHCKAAFHVGQSVMVLVHGTERVATIRWTRPDGQIGLRYL